jgi:hypothetical protein
MPKRHNCQARQYGDQMICAPCGLNWDVNDPEPPECRKVDRRLKAVKDAVKFESNPSEPARLPVKLPDDVAVEMVKTYQAHGGHSAGMQAAYRLFLDRMEP